MAKRKLLLADDSVTIQKVVNLTFADEGIDVITVGDGDSAMARLREERPDIVLADVNMPGANGYQICEALRTSDETRNIPVILLVGSFEPFDQIEASRVGANAFLTKPFQSIRQLVTEVTDLIGTAAPEPEPEPDVVTSGEFEIPMIQKTERSDDIESLYQQSVTGDFSSPAPAAVDYGDQGMDDEMIETSFAGLEEEPETLGYVPPEAAEAATLAGSSSDQRSEPRPEPEYAPPTEYSAPSQMETRVFEPEQPQNAWETQAARSFEPEQPSTWQSEPRSFEPEQPSTWEPEPKSLEPEQPPTWEPEPPRTYEPEPMQAASFQDQPVAEDRFSATFGTELRDETQTEAKTIAFHQQAETEEFTASSAGLDVGQEEPLGFMGEETVSFERSAFEPPDQKRILQEVELLELPPVGSNETLELTTVERADLMGSNKQVMSLSPELMEIIVQKVVERLSQKY